MPKPEPFTPLRDPSRCWRCGTRLHAGHWCPPCPKAGCGRDDGHPGDHLPSAPDGPQQFTTKPDYPTEGA